MKVFSNQSMTDAPMDPGVQAVSGTTITPTGLHQVVDIAQLSATTTMNVPTANSNGRVITLRFTDPNAKTINWDAGYAFGNILSTDIPNTAAKGVEVVIRYHGGSSKWRIVGLSYGY